MNERLSMSSEIVEPLVGRCADCLFWSKVGPLHGECGVAGEHEFLVSLPLRELDANGVYVPFLDPNFGTAKPRRYRALMLTSEAFGCVQFKRAGT